MSNQLLIVEKAEGCALVTINRPEALNALNHQLVAELRAALAALEQDGNVRAIVLTGSDRAFVAGADIKEMTGISVSAAYETAISLKALNDRIVSCSKPVIAAINGYCLGGGFELALACDIRIAGPAAVFGLPEIKLGLIPGGGGTQRLLTIVGPAVASHLIFTGDTFTAERAYELKLVSQLAENPREIAMELAGRLAAGSQAAITSIKRLLGGQVQQLLENRLHLEIDRFAMLFDHPDSLEGMRAFTEKRKPSFQ
ncbi:enoyl-CoA hydratase-related protein [Paenibacillus sp. MZ04-78.2]|uniref:enoyl-CoA hydratase/isomerase family protein n=1 Tax=Paenibacillus sp. MZ04-78.2 TaxID=2962034 RepID=UPI0020B6557D|nr:enoyl-CoA hydratase-related protein [Paenibacillus sp. MZ04-78.2]MCP3775764.1 enoyl-CoA hydratase-related protein [Paenibacillus sp. MZ04-78.2]